MSQRRECRRVCGMPLTRRTSLFWLLEHSIAEMSGAEAKDLKADPERWRIAGLQIRERERERYA